MSMPYAVHKGRRVSQVAYVEAIEIKPIHMGQIMKYRYIDMRKVRMIAAWLSQ